MVRDFVLENERTDYVDIDSYYILLTRNRDHPVYNKYLSVRRVGTIKKKKKQK